MSRSPRPDPSPNDQPHDDWFDAPSSPATTAGAYDPAAPPAARAAPAPRKRPLRTWVASGLGAAVLGVAAIGGVSYAANHAATTGTAATASADGQGAPGGMGGGPGGGGGGGTITAIDGSTLTVTLTAMGPQSSSSSSSGTATTVVTSSDTTFSTTTTGSLSDVQAGDHVMVMGSTGDDGTVAATAIVDQGTQAVSDGPGAGGAPPSQQSGSSDQQAPGQQSGGSGQQSGMPGRPTAGTVTAVDGSTLTVSTTDGSTVTVTTSSSTTVSVVHASTLADLAVGDTIRVMGSTGSDGTLTATAVREGADAMGPGARTS